MKSVRQLIKQGEPYKEKYPILQKLATKLREHLLNKAKKLHQATRDDINDLLPYPEVKKFLEDFMDYLEVALLKPTEVTPEQREAIQGEFDKALEQILTKTLAVDFQKGHLTANVIFVLQILILID